MPAGDILVHSGDFGGESIREVQAFGMWLNHHRQRYRSVVVVPGNHDILFESDPKPAEQSLRATAQRPRLHVLLDEAVTIGGLNFYGSPYTPAFNDWAFNLPRGSCLRDKWAQIPTDTQILVTHGPPLFIGDLVPADFDGGGGHVGCNDLRERIRSLPQLLLHCHGHIHEGFGTRHQDPKTLEVLDGPGLPTFSNASFMNGKYLPLNSPLVYDVEPGVAPVLVAQV